MNAHHHSVLHRIESGLYSRRFQGLGIWVILLITLLLLIQAAGISADGRFEKSLPLKHPYMDVFVHYQQEFGGANSLLVALQRTDAEGDIFEPDFLAHLKSATEQVFFLPGIDRTRVSSLFTRDVRFVEVVNGGFEAGDVIPAHYAPTPEMLALVRRNVGKAGVVGRLVANDQRGALIRAEVLDSDPASNAPTDHYRLAGLLESQLRQRFSSPIRYRQILRNPYQGLNKGQEVAVEFTAPRWWQRWGSVDTGASASSGSPQTIPRRMLHSVAEPNPEYALNIRVRIIGYSKLLGDLADASVAVVGFFMLTVIGTGIALWWFVGTLRLAWLPIGCALIAVIWEFGLLKLLGYGLDPYAVLVPFLVFAVSCSHGVQYVNTWVEYGLLGDSALQSSRRTFRQLFIPGTIALLTNVAGFMTIALVPIASMQEMALNAVLGMLAVIITNKILMPLLLARCSLATLPQVLARRQRAHQAELPLWRAMAVVTRPLGAVAIIALSLGVLAWSWQAQKQRIIGDAQKGVPELREDALFNQDVAAITANFSIGIDIFKVVAESDDWACINYQALDQIDRFTWAARNLPEVAYALSLPMMARQSYAGLWEAHPKFQVIPRSHDGMVLATKALETSSGLLDVNCGVMPVLVFPVDHRAHTISRMISKLTEYKHTLSAEFYQDHPKSNPAACQARSTLRRERGFVRARLRLAIQQNAPAQERLQDELSKLNAVLDLPGSACPVDFAFATGNVGVMAATNEVVAQQEPRLLFAVYAVIGVLVLLSYRNISGILVIGLPLFMVSVFANGLMAVLGIGLKVATLPVITLAVGIGVDYGIYIFDLLQHHMKQAKTTLTEAYIKTLQQTGKAVLFTGFCLAAGVVPWLLSGLQFQRDMGVLLLFMFLANMLGALLLGPAFAWLFLKPNTAAAK